MVKYHKKYISKELADQIKTTQKDLISKGIKITYIDTSRLISDSVNKTKLMRKINGIKK